MDAQGTECILGGIDSRKRIVHTEIPKADLTIATPRDELSEATTLHMDVGDPLLVLTPDFDHRCSRLQSLIKDTNGAITKASNKYVASHLV